MLKLTRNSIVTFEPDTPAQQHTWPLVVTAEALPGTTISPKIFVYHALDFGQASDGVMECVASVQQLDEIPEDQPYYNTETGVAIPYFRLATMAVNCRSAAEAEELWESIKEDTTDLVENFKALTRTQPVETFTTAS